MALDPATFGQLLETIRRFVQEHLRLLEGEVEANDAIPEDVVEEMKAIALFGIFIAPEYGGRPDHRELRVDRT